MKAFTMENPSADPQCDHTTTNQMHSHV